ncbi:hypothetical protein H9650_00045 [Psychrobacillus sp. Sa2BUA9]|uniref:DUF4177 domain-containing protein n=1 Tax=Psychrobacillus faecigallinarum TaxID=2762235 RepID=A0ABR8R427_9BACI|nr:hypothetical protein [Psychrobacillus faecigallinarum]MBD7942501.1 hypothetical protein [Psychrobacillus faecigallinarum]
MQQIFRNRKIEKAHTRRELEKTIAENEKRGWKQISEIREDYGNYQVLMKFTNIR